jgi:EmrB/QacA subfamily drug resistance transporter
VTRRAAHPRITLLATGLGLFMIFLDATIVNVALPDVQREFDVGEQGLQWVVAAYSLTMGMFIMSSATLADHHGRRRLFIIGVVLFSGASALCGVAPDIVVLNIARGIQGVGAATVNVASLALVSAAYPDPGAKAKAIGAWTGIAAVGLAVGPTLGGLMTEHIGWRSIFLVNVVVGAVAVLLVVLYVAESRDPTDRGLDPVGQLLFIIGIGALTYALIEAPQEGWGSALIVGLLVGSLVIGVAFVIAELRRVEPMMDVRVFKDPVYSTAIMTIFVVLFGIYGMMLIVTQYFQNVEGYSPEKAGVLMLATSVPTVIFAPLAGRIAARFGGRKPTLSGVFCLLVGLTVMGVGLTRSLWVVLVALALIGVASGLAVTPATSVAMSSVPPDRAGMASGIMSAQRAIGSTAGFAIMGSILAAVVGATLPAKLDAVIDDPSEAQQLADQIIDEANPRAVPALIGPGKPLPSSDAIEADQLEDIAEDAFEQGMRAALFVGAGLALAALVAGFVVFPKGKREDVETEVEATELEVEEVVREAET